MSGGCRGLSGSRRLPRRGHGLRGLLIVWLWLSVRLAVGWGCPMPVAGRRGPVRCPLGLSRRWRWGRSYAFLSFSSYAPSDDDGVPTAGRLVPDYHRLHGLPRIDMIVLCVNLGFGCLVSHRCGFRVMCPSCTRNHAVVVASSSRLAPAHPHHVSSRSTCSLSGIVSI